MGNIARGLGAAIAAVPLWAMPAVADTPQVVYPLIGVVDVHSGENAVGRLQLGLYGTVEVAADGSLSGGGAVVYTWMAACEWTPPNPRDTEAPWCRIDGVSDAAFTVSGSVLDTVHRHDTDNPLTADVFVLADNHTADRLDYAPLTLDVTIGFEGALAEHLSYWGFSTPNIEARDTEIGQLGALVSGMFDAPFQVSAVAGANVGTVRRGNFAPSPTTAYAMFGFVDVDPATLPTATDPWVYLQYPDNAPEERPLSEAEWAAVLAYGEDHPLWSSDLPRELSEDERGAIAAAEDGNPPRTSAVDREILQGGLDDLVEALAPYILGNLSLPQPAVGLLDDTRAPVR